VSDLVESIELPETDLAYLRDAYVQSFEASVVAVDIEGRRIALDHTYFYPTGGGQPNDSGVIVL
jgi:misacylated tRNA(Ala) deacylase